MADYYTLLTNAGIAYETACKAAGLPIKLSQLSVGDGGGAVYNPAATDTALKREVWRGPLNALFQDEKNPSWLLAEVTIPPEVGGWYVREAGIWTDTGILYAIVKYPESFKPVLATSGSGKEFYIRSIFETGNAALVTLLIDDTVVKATRAWVTSYVADELSKLDVKQSVRAATTANIVLSSAQTLDGVAVVAGDRVLVKNQTLAKDNGLYVVANGAWLRARDANSSLRVSPGLIVSVEQGTTLADTIWQLVTDGAIVLDTTLLMFQNITQGFAPLNSPVFSGNPTAPTANVFSNDNAVATTQFVQRALGNYAGQTNYAVSTELTVADVGKLLIFTEASLTATLPAWDSVPPGGLVTITSTAGVTVKAKALETLNAQLGAPGPFVLLAGSRGVFRRLLLGGGWSFEGGDASLKYSPVLTGPYWVTPPQFDNGKSFATTEFVQRAQGNFAGRVDILALPATLNVSSAGSRIVINATGILTLPPINSVPSGANFYIYNASPGVITIVRQGADIISSFVSWGLASVTLQSVSNIVITAGNGQWVVEGGMSSLKYSSEFAAVVGTAAASQQLPGLMIKVGNIANASTAATIPLTFPVSFPNACVGLVFTPWSTSGAVFSHNGRDKSGATVSRGANAAFYFDYIAIGY
ncbi:phage tail protein [Pseudomonas sp. dw_612]|uniref:phage tail protein n=1 Tax=Pseudomonas sp. dw_612 TaxID=2720080 RepID=UPI001BD4D0E9|nr:phage tail protein [Pseudomonas sp. dw_612]